MSNPGAREIIILLAEVLAKIQPFNVTLEDRSNLTLDGTTLWGEHTVAFFFEGESAKKNSADKVTSLLCPGKYLIYVLFAWAAGP